MATNTAKQFMQIDLQNPKPETGIVQSVTRDSQPATRDPQLATPNPQRVTRNPKPAYSLDLGLMEYREAWKLQETLVSARVNQTLNQDILLFLEHPAVFTLGRRGGLENLLVSEAFLKQSGIPLVQVERGGYITYHGPGQLVVYPIINLHGRRIGVNEFVEAMEAAMLLTAGAWNLTVERNPANRGIWAGSKKMGSIGIALRKGVSFHGLALNVNLDLTPFSWIQPCGLQGVGMTSMQAELGRQLPIDDVRSRLKKELQTVLGLQLEDRKLPDLLHQIQPTR
jgi:lipoate-protein ligase B